MSERAASDGQPPRVFVSYSDDSAAHAKRVLGLAQWLRSHGVDAHIDQFEESPEQGWPRWVYGQIRDAEFVLVIATPGYLARCEAEAARASGADSAVKFESHLSLQELHEAGGRNRKFVPVLFEDDAIVESVPLPLRGATCYRLPDQLDDLYRRLTGQPKVRRAPLGMLKTFDDESLLESVEDYRPEPRPRANFEEQRAEDSLRAVIDAGVIGEYEQLRSPRPRWRRSWFQANRRLAVATAAFAVGFVSVAFMLGRNSFMDPSDPICRIQLTDASGLVVEGIDRVDLALPSGHQIEVVIEDGNTLRFACPPVAVQAQAHLYLDQDPRETSSSNAGPSNPLEVNDPAQPERRIDGRVALPAPEQASDKVKRARLMKVQRADPKPAAVNGHSSPASAVSGGLRLRAPELDDCYEQALRSNPDLHGSMTYAIGIDPSGRVTDVKIESDTIHDSALRTCTLAKLERWRVTAELRFTVDF